MEIIVFQQLQIYFDLSQRIWFYSIGNQLYRNVLLWNITSKRDYKLNPTPKLIISQFIKVHQPLLENY